MATSIETYEIKDAHSVRCPYCGAPLYLWANENGECEWDEICGGHFYYREHCEECGKEVRYGVNFVITTAEVEEDG